VVETKVHCAQCGAVVGSGVRVDQTGGGNSPLPPPSVVSPPPPPSPQRNAGGNLTMVSLQPSKVRTLVCCDV
jgi:hypothetical protein